MRRLSAPLVLSLLAASFPLDAAAALGRAAPVRVPLAGVGAPAVAPLVTLPAGALTLSPALAAPALSPSVPLAAPALAPAPGLVAAAARLAAASGAPARAPGLAAAPLEAALAAPAPAGETAEQGAARAAALFDASLPAAADAPQLPQTPTPGEGGGFDRLPRGHGPTRRLFGQAPSGPLGKLAGAAARVTGVSWLRRHYRETFVLQRHAARLQDPAVKPSARAASARLLAEIGAVEAAPLLGWAAEHDPSARVRRVAAYGLRIMAEHSAPRLVQAMRARVTPAGREGAATALGWLVAHHESPDALLALGTAAVLDPSDTVRLAAVRSLGRSPSVQAVKLLYWVQAHAPRPGLRAAVEQALREQAERTRRMGLVLYQPPADEFGEVSSPIQSSALKRSVVVGLTFAALEFAGGLLTGNAALKADALHLAGDRLLDATGIFALYLARRPPSARRTYGYIKAEAVFALLGALVIAGVAAGMVPDVWHGLSGVYAWLFLGGAALPAAGWAVAAYASLGLVSNLFSGFLLLRHKEGSMTARAAFLHVMADAMGSAGIILTTAAGALLGWTFLQPLVFAFIVYLILHTAWELGKPAWDVLMDAVPPGLDLDALEADILSIPGIASVYDLHVRQLNGASAELAAKALVRAGADRDAALAALQAMLREKYKITHATIQLEGAP